MINYYSVCISVIIYILILYNTDEYETNYLRK